MNSVSGTIGYERDVEIEVHADRVQVGRYYIPLKAEIERSSLSNAVADLIDLQARTWGAPPNGFYWVPSISYQVHEGGQSQYQRLYGITRALGLSARAQMASPPPNAK